MIKNVVIQLSNGDIYYMDVFAEPLVDDESTLSLTMQGRVLRRGLKLIPKCQPSEEKKD